MCWISTIPTGRSCVRSSMTPANSAREGQAGWSPAVADDLAEVLRGMREDDVRNIIHLAYAQCENPLESRAKRLFEAAKDAKRQRHRRRSRSALDRQR